MPLIRDGQIIEDRFVRVVDDAPVPDTGAVIVPATRFLADHAELTTHSFELGVLWPNDRAISQLAPYLDRLALVALVFPNFRDGRAYSQARQLREAHGFRGELRATGEILRDQFVFLLRAGFDAFEVKKPRDALAFVAAVARYSVFYQPTGDGRTTIRQARSLRTRGISARAAREYQLTTASRRE